MNLVSCVCVHAYVHQDTVKQRLYKISNIFVAKWIVVMFSLAEEYKGSLSLLYIFLIFLIVASDMFLCSLRSSCCTCFLVSYYHNGPVCYMLLFQLSCYSCTQMYYIFCVCLSVNWLKDAKYQDVWSNLFSLNINACYH